MSKKNLDCELRDPVIYISLMLIFNMDPTYESTIGPGVIQQTLILTVFMH